MRRFGRRFFTNSSSSSNQSLSNNNSSNTEIPKKSSRFKLEHFKSKPFWIEDEIKHRELFKKAKNSDDPRDACCFNHMIGLPWKDSPENTKPIFDYEVMLTKQLKQHKLLWIKKARGLGITEFMLRYMIWLCYFSNEYQHSQFFIIAGTHMDVAIEHIRRIKDMIYPFEPTVFDEARNVVTVNGCRFRVFPSRNVKDARGYTNVKFIFIDEADFFEISEQNEARDVAEGYILKHNPWIVMVSTPNEPGGLFETIEKMPEDQCAYKRIFLDYAVGVNQIYGPELELEKKQSYFEREYNLKYGYGIGNLFEQSKLEKVEELGRLPQFLDFDTINYSTKKSMGIDPGYGFSLFAFVITEEVDGLIRILYAQQFQRPNFETMVKLFYDLTMTYHLNNGINRIYVDGANPSFIRDAKSIINENSKYEELIKKNRLRNKYWEPYQSMTVVPVPFSTKHKAMLEHTKSLVEQGRVAINPDKFPELMNDLRIARVEGLVLDKQQQNHMDLFDAFRLSLEYYK